MEHLQQIFLRLIARLKTTASLCRSSSPWQRDVRKYERRTTNITVVKILSTLQIQSPPTKNEKDTLPSLTCFTPWGVILAHSTVGWGRPAVTSHVSETLSPCSTTRRVFSHSSHACALHEASSTGASRFVLPSPSERKFQSTSKVAKKQIREF